MKVRSSLRIHGEDKLVAPLRAAFKTSNPFSILYPPPEGMPEDEPTTEKEMELRWERWRASSLKDWKRMYWGCIDEPKVHGFTEDKPTSFTVEFETEEYAVQFIRVLMSQKKNVSCKYEYTCLQQNMEGVFVFRGQRVRRDRSWRISERRNDEDLPY